MEPSRHNWSCEKTEAQLVEYLDGTLAASTRAQAEGELVDGVEPATAARLLLCLLEGMRVVSKTSSDRSISQAVVQTLVDRFAK
jgi:TetR/AcrR family transcriptional repressor of nem operon